MWQDALITRFLQRLVVVLMAAGFIRWLFVTDAYQKGEALGGWLVIGAVMLLGSFALLVISWVINPSWPKQLVSGKGGGAITFKHVVLVIVGSAALFGALVLFAPT